MGPANSVPESGFNGLADQFLDLPHVVLERSSRTEMKVTNDLKDEQRLT